LYIFVCSVKVQLELIIAEIKREGILGMHFLIAVPDVLDFQNMKLSCNKEEIPLQNVESEPLSYRLFLKKTVTVPAGTVVVVTCRATKWNRVNRGN